MNKTLIEWTDFTWNIVVGCLFGCTYCYARRQAKRSKHRCERCYRFLPHFHAERLDAPSKVKEPSKIFVCSMGELFGKWVPRQWTEAVFQTVRKCPQHIFQFLTKSPLGAKACIFPENAWLGVSIDTLNALGRLDVLRKVQAPVRFVSFEPLLGSMGNLDLSGINWVIVGAQTGPNAIQPDPAWVARIIEHCRQANIPVFLKNNLHWSETLQEWPSSRRPNTQIRHAPANGNL